MTQPNPIVRAQRGVTARWAALKQRRPGVRHVSDAWSLLQHRHGNQYAAAITYFSFLALFPLLLLAVAITGFVLHAHPAAQQGLFNHITENVPGTVGTTLHNSIQTAINARTGVGIVGLLGVVLSGLGWIGNLRAAVDAVWGREPPPRNFLLARVANLVVLAGLGLGSLVSVGITVAGSALTDQLLRVGGLNDLPGLHLLTQALGLVVAAAGDMFIFWWLLVRLPELQLPRRVVLRGALLGAVGFEVLKLVGTVTVARTSHSPTAGPFAGLVAVLIWIQLVARFLLFCAAWMATAVPVPAAAEAPAPVEEPSAPAPAPTPAPLAVAGALLGAGALAGAAALRWAATRRPAAGARGPR